MNGKLTQAEMAYRQLREDIISGRRAPGERMTEKTISAALGYGASPLRAALTRLDHDGLVRTLPRKGYQVTPLTPKFIDDLFLTWSIVGPEVVRRGLATASTEQLAAIRTAFAAIADVREKEAANGNYFTAIEAADAAFGLLSEATANDHLIALTRRLLGDLVRTFVMILDDDSVDLIMKPTTGWVREVILAENASNVAEVTRTAIAGMHQAVMQIASRWPSVMDSEVVVRSAS